MLIETVKLAIELMDAARRLRRELAVRAAKRKVNRTAIRAAQIKMHEEAVERMTDELEPFFMKQVKSAASKLRGASGDDPAKLAKQIFKPRQWDKPLIDAALPPMAAAMVEGAVDSLAGVGIRLLKSSQKATTASEWLASEGLGGIPGVSTELPTWLGEEIKDGLTETFEQDYWKGINDTTLDDMESMLAKGLTEGQSVRTMAAEMTKLGPQFSKTRAERIARTEMAHALNGGRDASIRGLKEELGEAGEFIGKSWLSVLGNTTRDTHANLDGVLADENGMWNLGGVDVPWPGHISLPPEERINCQCTIVMEADVSEEQMQGLIEEEGVEGKLQGEEMPPANPDGKSTIERFKNADGTWTKERQALHDEIIDSHFEGKTSVKKPNSYMLGGGPASGKSTVLDAGLVKFPKNTVKIDSDGIKDSLPEYTKMLKDKNKGAAAFVHEETSHISKRIMARGIKEKYNVLLDGTGDSSLDGLRKKTAKMRVGGRKVNAEYMTIETDLSVKIANIRGKKTGRFVPESVVRGIHSSVSRVVPQAVEEGLYDNLNVWDNNKKGEAVLIASAKGKELTVRDKDKWEKFLAKGKEGV
jgi:predicted ABC-type ATPase